MERYGIVRDGLVLWVECFAEAGRMIKQYGGRLICEPEVVQASDTATTASCSPDGAEGAPHWSSQVELTIPVS